MDRSSVLNMDGTHTTVGPNTHEAVIHHDTLYNGYSTYDDERESNVMFLHNRSVLFCMMLLMVLYEAVSMVLGGAICNHGTHKIILTDIIIWLVLFVEDTCYLVFINIAQ